MITLMQSIHRRMKILTLVALLKIRGSPKRYQFCTNMVQWYCCRIKQKATSNKCKRYLFCHSRAHLCRKVSIHHSILIYFHFKTSVFKGKSNISSLINGMFNVYLSLHATSYWIMSRSKFHDTLPVHMCNMEKRPSRHLPQLQTYHNVLYCVNYV